MSFFLGSIRSQKPFEDQNDLIRLVNNWEGPEDYRQLKGLYLAALIEYPEFSAEIHAHLGLLAANREMTKGVVDLADSVLGKKNQPPEVPIWKLQKK